jgi:hypothetical protein
MQFKDGIYVEGPTSGNDTLSGTYSDDILDALAGNDTVFGGYGKDKLSGGRPPSGGPGRMLVHERLWGHGGGGR